MFGVEHAYSEQFAKRVTSTRQDHAIEGQSILRAAREDLAGGHLVTVKALVAADLFADFLDMAYYLLAEGYKDASAVMIGSVLEEHLRQLCHKHGIPVEVPTPKGKLVPKKADVMNADLTKAGVYTSIDQKAATGWLALRNSAAHGEYDEYSADQIRLMQQGVVGFLARIPL